MKRYRKPLFKIVELDNEQLLNNGSPGGVETGGTPGNEFNDADASYSKRQNRIIIDDEEDF